MAWTIDIEDRTAKEIKKLGSAASDRIYRFLRERLAVADNPRSLGKPLSGSELGEYWSYRVGDYRLICDIQESRLVVVVVTVGHRREVYR